MHKDTNVEKGESYIKSRSREYRNIVLVCMAALIVIVVGIVVLVEVFRTEIPKVSVFDENGNEIGIYEDGGEVSFVKNKLGYDFAGWVDTESGEIYTTLQEALEAGSKSVKQKWDLKTYTLTLYIRGGKILGDDSYEFHEAEDDKGDYYTKTFTVESNNIILPSSAYIGSVKIEKLGSAFKFWSQLPSSEDSSTAVKQIQQGSTRSIVLYAVWNADPYVVNFVDVYGKYYDQYVLNYKDIIVKPEKTFEKEGYEFGGYFTDSSFSKEFKFDEEIVTKKLDVFIKWIPKEYVIEYYKGETLIETKQYHTDEDIQEYICPLEGKDALVYTFKAWLIDNNINNVFNNQTMPPKNLKLYAQLEKIQYTVTWIIGENQFEDKYEYEAQLLCNHDTSKAPTETTVYEFKEWLNENDEPVDINGALVTQNVTYKASYTSSDRYYSYKILDAESNVLSKGVGRYEEEINFPDPTPTKESTIDKVYTFSCWISNDGKTTFDEGTFTLTSDIIIIPKYLEATRKYSVIFCIYNEESGESDKELYTTQIEYGSKVFFDEENYGKLIENYTNGTKTYSFKSWSVNLDEYIVQGDTTIFAIYESDADKYHLHFYSDNVEIGVKDIDIGDEPIYIEDPIKAEDAQYTYTFVCWYIDKNDNGQFDIDDSEQVNANSFDEATKDEIFNLYAHYSKQLRKYTLYYDTNGGSEVLCVEIENGTDLSIYIADDLTTKEGYTFIKWEGIPEDNLMPIEDLIITATWQINQYTITFDTNGGSEIAPITQDYGTDITPPEDPTKEGYTFKGWDKEIPSTMPAGDMTITATWQINQYTITFDTNGGSEIAPITQDYGTKITIPENPTKTGYTFKGWDKEIPGTMPEGDMTITATWEIIQYTITFDTNGGSEIEPITQDYGTEITAPDDPMKTGYTFMGWDKEIPSTMPAEDMTIKATWQINKYTITFDTDGGSEIEPITQDFGTEITIPESPSKTGYTFKEWEGIPEDNLMPAENITIKATWQINQYTITFDTNGGSAIAPITQEYGTEITIPKNPTKIGYTFKEWDIEIPDIMPAENMTIKALWQINQYTITFDTDGGSEIDPITQDYGTEIAIPENPTKIGYTFNGWKGIPEDNLMPAENITIKALWIGNTYIVSFDSNGGEEILGTEVTFGSEYGALPSPTKEDYEFVGWKLDTIVINSSTIVETASNHTLKAVWKLKEYTITLSNNLGLELTSIKYTIEDDVILPSDLVVGIYRLDGWYNSSSFAGSPILSYEKGTIRGDFTLYGNYYTNGITFNLIEDAEGDYYSVCSYDKNLQTTIIFIPKVYQGKPVTTIEQSVFRYAKNIQTVICNDILYIKENAFAGCTNLKTVNMRSVKIISEAAFSFCASLETVYMINVEVIGIGAFSLNTSLKEITISTSLQEVKDEAFIQVDRMTIIYNGSENDFNEISVDTSTNAAFIWDNVKK
ncbi:MAG: InlB B-repeat-containing protein [Christensenella sp.]|nr:InlB B-repeat-containing protein [Christensenella sp.]